MKNNGVTMTDNSRFVEAVVVTKKLGFDADVIAGKVSNLVKLEIDQKGFEERVKSLKEDVKALEQEELSYSIYRELEKMGIKQLKLLLNTVTEIATANNRIHKIKLLSFSLMYKNNMMTSQAMNRNFKI
jgi:hypothetical protein